MTAHWTTEKDDWGSTTHVLYEGEEIVAEAYQTGTRLQTGGWAWAAYGLTQTLRGTASTLYTAKIEAEKAAKEAS